MRVLVGGLAVLGLLVLANLVAAGVMLSGGFLLQLLLPGWASPWPWLAVCVAGVGASVLFLRSCLLAPAWIRARRRRLTT